MAGVSRVRFTPQQLGMVVVVLLCAVVHLASSLRSCAVSSGKMRIANPGIGYFNADSDHVQIKVHLRDEPHCREVYKLLDLDMDPLNEVYTYNIDISELTATNTTVITGAGRRRRDLWYEIGVVPCKWAGLFLRIGSRQRSLPLNQTIVTEIQTMASLGLFEGRGDLAFPCYPSHVDILVKDGRMGCPKTQHDTDPRLTCAQTLALPTVIGQSVPHGYLGAGSIEDGSTEGGSRSGSSGDGESSADGSLGGRSRDGSSEGRSLGDGSSAGESSSGGSLESDPVVGGKLKGVDLPFFLQTLPPPLPPTPPPLFPSGPSIPQSILDAIDSPDVLREAHLPPDHTGDQDAFEYRGQGEENAVPIFIGVLAFSLSMCLRFCLCRGKSVVQRVTTVTVIRSRPVDESQENQENVHDASLDPPPAYVDVVNETPSTCPSSNTVQDPPPPPYSDIDPPPYYELEGVRGQESIPQQPYTTPQQTPFSPPYATPTEQSHSTTQQPHSTPQQNGMSPQQPHSTPTEEQEPPETPSGSVSSNIARAIQSRTRSLQKQFSFRPLEEEEEEEDK